MLNPSASAIHKHLRDFSLDSQTSLFDGNKTLIEDVKIASTKIRRYTNEFWTAGQRQSDPIHEISYRACFKAQLPRFFIELLTKPDDLVYDPFMGRGTTLIEAAILGRHIIGNDINPLSQILTYPRIHIPKVSDVKKRLASIPTPHDLHTDIDLSMFYHKHTASEIMALKNYLEDRKQANTEDDIDKWIRMIATNRLTGHSPGFFSVYTLPPNQAVSSESQIKINQKRNQIPEYKEIRIRILNKTKSLLRGMPQEAIERINRYGKSSKFLTEDSRRTKKINKESVSLTVTSPPFLDIVQYSQDNWLRGWFNSIDVDDISQKITVTKSIDEWSNFMQKVFKELYRITKPNGWIAFEVGEVRKGTVKLEEYIIPVGIKAGFQCLGILINLQKFTKTSNIWGVNNNQWGTNTNRIVLFQKK